MTWFGFSDEGMLISLDDKGVISALNMQNQQWIPVLDLKQKFPRNHDCIWVVGFMEHKFMYIEMQKDSIQPHEQLKSKYKTLDLKIPFIFSEKNEEGVDKQEEDIAQTEQELMKEQLVLDHEKYRHEVWMPYKLFRGSNDNERFLSESILDQKDIMQKKKNIDKTLISAIRVAITNDEPDKVFTYLEQLNFTNSMKLVVKLCNNMNQNHLSQRVSMYIDEKTQKDTMAK